MSAKTRYCTSVPAQSVERVWPPVLHELHRQLRAEMALASYHAADLLEATDDVIERELAEAGEKACAYFIVLWVRLLREQNRSRGAS